MNSKKLAKFSFLILCLGAAAVTAACSCGENTPGNEDQFTDFPFDWPADWGDTWPDWFEVPDNVELCDPSERYCEGNARYWCEDGIMHYEECGEDEYCEFGECLPRGCEPGETRCTGDGKIMICREDGSGFGEPQDCPDGEICEGGVCTEIICTPDETYCVDLYTEMRCNRLGTAWEEIECSPSYICDVDHCRLQICPPGMAQCVTDTSYHVCNEYGTEYGDPIECPDDTGCFEGRCLSLCEMAEMSRSSVGCTFYAVDQHNRYDSATYYIVVGNTNDFHTASVLLENRRGGTWNTVDSVALAPNSLHTFSPSTGSQVSSTTGFGQGYAFKITSDVPIIAYQLNAIGTCTGEGSMLIPVNALDSSYYLVTYRGYSGPSIFSVVGVVDGTSVQITPTTNTQGGGSIPAMTAGVTTTIDVSECDVAQVLASNVADDLTGTHFEATNPIAVFTGTYCSHIPQGCTFCHTNDCLSCDPLEEQQIPKTTWGRIYVADVSPEFNWGYFKVVAEQDATTINFTYAANTTGRFPAGTDLPSITLNALENSEFELGCTESGGGCGLALVEADKPILLMNYIEGGECRTQRCMKDHCPGNYADPSMITIPPIEQYMREYLFLTPSGFTNNYVTVIREMGATVTMDGAAVSATFLPVASSIYEVGHVAVAEGTHHILSSLPFGIILEGYGYANSYGYPGGMNLEIINP